MRMAQLRAQIVKDYGALDRYLAGSRLTRHSITAYSMGQVYRLLTDANEAPDFRVAVSRAAIDVAANSDSVTIPWGSLLPLLAPETECRLRMNVGLLLLPRDDGTRRRLIIESMNSCIGGPDPWTDALARTIVPTFDQDRSVSLVQLKGIAEEGASLEAAAALYYLQDYPADPELRNLASRRCSSSHSLVRIAASRLAIHQTFLLALQLARKLATDLGPFVNDPDAAVRLVLPTALTMFRRNVPWVEEVAAKLEKDADELVRDHLRQAHHDARLPQFPMF